MEIEKQKTIKPKGKTIQKTIEKELKERRKQFRGPSGPLRLVWLCPGALG